MKKMTKRILCSVFVLVFMLSSMATTAFAAVYPAEDMETSDNQFLNPGFESSSNDWLAISKMYKAANFEKATPDTNNELPYDTDVYYGNSGRSLKVVESTVDSFVEIGRIKDYYKASGTKNIAGAYEDGYNKFIISGYFKNASNVKGIQISLRYESSSSWATVFQYDAPAVDLNGEEWSKVETTVDLNTIKSTLNANKGELFDIEKLGAGTMYIRFTPVSIENAELCTYNIDDVEIKYEKGYKYRNLVDDGSASCESLTGFTENSHSNDIERAIDSTQKHSGNGSLKITVPAGYKALASFKPTGKLIAGEKYYFSLWYYSESEKSNDRIFLRYATQNNTNISNWVTGTSFDSAVYLNKGQWKKYEYTFTATDTLVNNMTNFYISTEMNGSSYNIYLDDISLRRVPTAETKREKEYIGNVAYGDSIALSFDKEIDPFTLPTRISLGTGAVVNATSTLINDGMTVVITFEESFPLALGTGSLSFQNLKDVWGRMVDDNPADEWSSTGVSFTVVDPVTVSANIYASESATTPLEAWAAGDLVAKANLKNISSKEQTYNCVILFANYQGTELKGVNKVDVTNQVIGAGQTVTISNPLTVSEGDNLKVMVWDGMSNMLPIINAVAK